MDITLPMVLGLVRAAAITLSILLDDDDKDGNAIEVAMGQVLALTNVASRLAKGEKPNKLPTYEEGLALYRAARQGTVANG